MSSLRDVLIKMIKVRGPLTIASYMKQALTHPEHGYYMKKDPFGTQGDFITSPEISQMFGELLGINILMQWMQIGEPQKVRIVELGPGRGTLMDDMLRSWKSFPNFQKSIKQVQLVEASPTLREMQNKRLEPYNIPLDWLNLTKEIPRDGMPTFIVAHEFLDALPIHQFVKDEMGWKEKLVDYNAEKDGLVVVKEPTSGILAKSLAKQPRYDRLPNTSEVEISPESWDVAREIGSIVQANKGGALIIDYGPSDTIPVNTFRAFKDHKQVDPFTAPGDADLTSDVDFRGMRDIFTALKLNVSGPVTQRDWLLSMGIGARATMLANNQTTEEGKKRISDAYNRLTDSSHMGKTYKFMSVSTSPEPIPGFESKTNNKI